ncbi:YybH family protein [Pseudorhodoplanes sp.]|uniref:YybH family protein n=1 Tax=Pseudorhodoplanes sp. TaxID=1934341 RepID=UPI0039192F5E
MKRLPVSDDDRRSIEAFFERWGTLVGNVDFRRARELYTEDVIAFGSLGKMLTSRAALEAEQWRAVWPTLADYRHDLATLEIVVSPDRLMAMGAVMARTTGIHRDGSHFERPARVTATLMRETIDAPWFMTHTHVSLVPGTPVPSYGQRPEAG